MCPPWCGDGIISRADEATEYECDDGNNWGYKVISDPSCESGNDGCDATPPFAGINFEGYYDGCTWSCLI